MAPLILFMLGRPGCGKSTQAEFLAQQFNLIYLGSGQLLRERAESPDFTGRKISEVLRHGDLSPTFLIAQLWLGKLEKIKEAKDSNLGGIIFDGSPRKLMETQLLEEALAWYGWNQGIRVFLIDISRQESFDRLTKRRVCQGCGKIIPYLNHFKNLKECDQCGGELKSRADDNFDAIGERLDVFEQEVMPVVEYYQGKGCLIRINGNQPIEVVRREIISRISSQT